MAKLQLYIAKSLRGYKSVMNIHPEEDVRRNIGDFRNILSQADYDVTKVNIYYLLAYRTHGVLITVLRTIPNVKGDHLAATLYVPDKVIIGSEELLDVISHLTTILSASEVDSEGTARLREILAKDYPISETTARKVETDGRNYAVAYYGAPRPSMEDYAATGFYTPAFGDTAGILLLPTGTECTLNDITPDTLPELMTLNPPPEGTRGFQPHIYHRLFNEPYLVPKGGEVEIVWRRSGYDNIVQTVTADSADSASEVPETRNAHKAISPAMFYITAERSRETITDATIHVNGCEITVPVVFTYAELERATVEISAPGYLNYSGRLDLATTTQALVQLKELRKTYRFDLPIQTPEPEECIHFSIDSKKELTDSPLEGYAIAGGGKPIEGITHSNTLVYAGKHSGKMLYKILGVWIVGLLCGMLLCWLLFVDGTTDNATEEIVEETEEYHDDNATTEKVVVPASTTTDSIATASQPAEEPGGETQAENRQTAAQPEQPVQQERTTGATTTTITTAAIRYLDDNKVWSKEGLENVGLNGLFEDLNQYNFERLKNYWSTRLNNSSRFNELIVNVKNAASKPDPRRGNHTPTYNRTGDTKINIYGYRCHIDP